MPAHSLATAPFHPPLIPHVLQGALFLAPSVQVPLRCLTCTQWAAEGPAREAGSWAGAWPSGLRTVKGSQASLQCRLGSGRGGRGSAL